MEVRHSPVYYDGYLYVTLVAHVAGVNHLIDPEDEGPIVGLLEYSLCPEDGMLRVYDMDDEAMYEVEDWEGLDKDAVQHLLDAADGIVDVMETGKDYRRVRNEYLRTGDPEKAVSKHKVGTVVRIDYGDGADIVHKVGWNEWHIAGAEWTWTDAQVEEEDYEVIYSAGE